MQNYMKLLIDYCLSRKHDHDSHSSYLILLFRCFSGIMMMPYGYGKIVNYDRYAADFFGDPLGIGNIPSLWMTVFAQVVCPVMLVLGFHTRISAAILAFNMLVAVKYHFFDSFNVKVLPMLFLGLYMFQVLFGSGKYSLDFMLYSSKGGPVISRSEKWGVCCVAAALAALCIVFSDIISGWAAFILLIPTAILLVISYNACLRN